MDSIDKTIEEQYKDIIIKLNDQNENDLRKAITWTENNNATDIIILGATGKREDHSLANIFSITLVI